MKEPSVNKPNLQDAGVGDHTFTDDDLETALADPAADDAGVEEDLEALQELLFGPYRQRTRDLEAEIEAMQAELVEIERTINDKQALIDTMTPIVASSIRQSIADSKEEMIEALYPIMGRLVTRAVGEAMRELVKRIDAQMRHAFSIETITRKVKAKTMGVSEAELALRDALPFAVDEVFLIHRETGIVLRHASATPAESRDPDLISGMLTAIRDFAQDAFGRGDENELDEIQYGGAAILIETAQYAYLAVATEGFSPQGFRAEIRDQLYQIEETMGSRLRDFDGDVTPFQAVDPLLEALFPVQYETAETEAIETSTTPSASPKSSRKQNQMLLAGFMVILGVLLLGWLLWEIGSILFSGENPANAQFLLPAALFLPSGANEGDG